MLRILRQLKVPIAIFFTPKKNRRYARDSIIVSQARTKVYGTEVGRQRARESYYRPAHSPTANRLEAPDNQ
jgi:hypothetical protein